MCEGSGEESPGGLVESPAKCVLATMEEIALRDEVAGDADTDLLAVGGCADVGAGPVVEDDAVCSHEVALPVDFDFLGSAKEQMEDQ